MSCQDPQSPAGSTQRVQRSKQQSLRREEEEQIEEDEEEEEEATVSETPLGLGVGGVGKGLTGGLGKPEILDPEESLEQVKSISKHRSLGKEQYRIYDEEEGYGYMERNLRALGFCLLKKCCSSCTVG